MMTTRWYFHRFPSRNGMRTSRRQRHRAEHPVCCIASHSTLGRSSRSAHSMEALDPNESDGDVAHGGSSLFRYAAQPDVVLSQERDLYYANTLLGEGASELAETLLGSRRVMILAPELRALASCLYFGLTNLAGRTVMMFELALFVLLILCYFRQKSTVD